MNQFFRSTYEHILSFVGYLTQKKKGHRSLLQRIGTSRLSFHSSFEPDIFCKNCAVLNINFWDFIPHLWISHISSYKCWMYIFFFFWDSSKCWLKNSFFPSFGNCWMSQVLSLVWVNVSGCMKMWTVWPGHCLHWSCTWKNLLFRKWLHAVCSSFSAISYILTYLAESTLKQFVIIFVINSSMLTYLCAKFNRGDCWAKLFCFCCMMKFQHFKLNGRNYFFFSQSYTYCLCLFCG